ncbi:putative ring and ubp finger domain [Phaeomoniella chlamydospora]|uniref:Putative ring and ubp finger domain n=1 Tax=Phaeomoniella chlamydospora TaxID=158046 RepID=A0A0G2H0N8_PHACM|nr:putative ring and ubp finger domain [Phaeomoniella chlamydospora]
MKNDPFSSNPATTTAVKPIAPRTPSLIEFPTCPVCLERMDETTGLLTIPCQHVFHCTCLEKWSGGGCPVCRYTHDDFSSRRAAAIGLNTDPSIEPLECETCHADHNLWQCLICGKIGCGRYDAAHAFQHYQTTSHSFAMDMESKRVWDYEGDAYIHRIIQSSTNVPGDKLVELPSSRDNQTSALDPHGDHHNPFNSAETDTDSYDPIPRIKLDNLSLEYTHLLTSQLESQRVYYESLIGAAADKASQASSLASTSQSTITSLETELTTLRKNYTTLIETTLPALERETQRLTQRTTKFESLSRSLTADLQTEKSLSNHLMTRISFLESQSSTQQQEIKSLQSEKLDLQDQNRDLSFFISTQDKIRELDDVDQKNEIQSGILQVPVVHDPSSADADAETGTGSASGSGKKKKRNKGKGKASN